MHFVGKVLVGLQLVLSILFMAFAGAVFSVQESWREKAGQVQTNYDQLQQEHRTLSANLEQVQKDTAAEIQGHQDRANAALADVRRLTEANQALLAERDSARRERDALMANSNINDREAKERRAEALAQRDVNSLLHQQRDQLRTRIKTLEDLVFSKDVEMRRMVDRQTQALEEIALWRRAAQAAGLKPDPRELAGQQDPPPLVAGKVLAVEQGQGAGEQFIEISLGEDDGLLKGHELHVYSTNGRGKYLGKVRIVYTQADRAVAVVIDQTRNGRISRGDDVSTQL
jgi:uncharacterized protein YlxW (UPF0749 family)